MSVLEATIFYTRTYAQDLKDEVQFSGRILSYSARRMLAFFAIGSTCALGVVYIYLVGNVVAGGFTKEKLQRQLEGLYAQVQNIESAALQEGRTLTSEFFVSLGYYEPRSLDAITRSRNVAETSQNSRFY